MNRIGNILQDRDGCRRRRRVSRPRWGRGGGHVHVSEVLPAVLAELDERRERAVEGPAHAVDDGLHGHGEGHVEAPVEVLDLEQRDACEKRLAAVLAGGGEKQGT